jgi:uncharacterized protein (TIGR03084 family)
MAVPVSELLVDLIAETEVVESLLEPLAADTWALPTPASGWAIRDQISHLAYFDQAAALAATDPERFRREAHDLLAGGPDFPDRIAEEHRGLSSHQLHNWFRQARSDLVEQMRDRDPAQRVPWYGPDMSVASSITARLMETWAHGQDIADALGERREPTTRLRHIAHLGVRTLPFSFRLRGRAVPAVPVRIELTAPDGSTWTWGPEDASDLVSGPALDFCLAVTQRRHVDDTTLNITGPVAGEWMSIAQAFAGSPGPGRVPGQFTEEKA